MTKRLLFTLVVFLITGCVSPMPTISVQELTPLPTSTKKPIITPSPPVMLTVFPPLYPLPTSQPVVQWTGTYGATQRGILISGMDADNRNALYTLNIQNSNAILSLLTYFSVGQPLDFSLSPDNTKLLHYYYNYDVNAKPKENIDYIDLATRNLVVLTWVHPVYGTDTSSPSWSPDGKEVVFECHPGGVSGICVIRGDGTYPRYLTGNVFGNGERFECPAWAPDGREIAFLTASNVDHSSDHVYVMTVDGTNVIDLSQSVQPGRVNGCPAWSPDGTRIAFGWSREYGTWNSVFVAQADGSGALDDFSRYTDASTHSGGLSQVAWSPNGAYIAFASSSYKSGYLYITPGRHTMHTGTTAGHLITDYLSYSWSLDGKEIVYASQSTLGVINIDGIVEAPLVVTLK